MKRLGGGRLHACLRAWIACVNVIAGSCAVGATSAVAPACSAADREPSAAGDDDLLATLQAIPGMTVTEAPVQLGKARVYHLTFDQPVNHDDPAGARFSQRLVLHHRSREAPTVLHLAGYFVSPGLGEHELTSLLRANELVIEHRFFASSTPVPPDWRHLTIREAARDDHRVVEALRPAYSGKWISTGASKGGLTALVHRRYFPADVDATVAYVAPLVQGTSDARFAVHLANAARESGATCRERLTKLQRAALERRGELLPVMTDWARASGASFERVGLEQAFEISVLETPFALFQYHGLRDCAVAPDEAAPADKVFAYIDSIVDIDANFSDRAADAFEAYWYQAATELGAPAIPEEHLRGLLKFPGIDNPNTFAPRGVATSFDPQPLRDVAAWIATQGERILLLYGEQDPWSAAAVDLGSVADSYRFFVPNGSHSVTLRDLPPGDQARALEAVARWGAVSALPGARDPSLDSLRLESTNRTPLFRF